MWGSSYTYIARYMESVFYYILLQWYWRLAVQCGETDDESGILKWWSTFILLRRINTWSVLPFIRGFWYSYTCSYIGHWRLVIFFFLFWSIHLIFMENFINVIMKRNKFHAMTYPPRQTLIHASVILLFWNQIWHNMNIIERVCYNFFCSLIP